MDQKEQAHCITMKGPTKIGITINYSFT